MSFNLTVNNKQVPVTVPKSITLGKQTLEQFSPWKNWITKLEGNLKNNPNFQFNNVEIQSVDYFGNNKLGFLKFKSEVIHPNGKQLPGIVVLRGGSVTMLVQIKCKESNERYVILTSQPRVAAGQLTLHELPAGMIDDGTFRGAAAREIEEECGIKISEDELTELSDEPILISPGLLDETMSIFTCTKEMSQSEINELEGKLTGNPEESEAIALKIVKFDELMDYQKDAKLLLALALLKSKQNYL